MSFLFKLLIVEDDGGERAAWQRTIDMHNANEAHGFKIDPSYAASLKEATEMIESQDFNAAVVDIRLDQPDITAPNNDGNLVISKLLDNELAVIAVFTGEDTQVEIPDWAQTVVNTFRKGGDDGEGTGAVMGWLTKQVPMVEAINKAEKTIKKEMVKLFTHSIWPRWKNWVGTDNDLAIPLSRHLASHIHAALLEGSSQQAHPEEWYFTPPVRDGIRTGDLIKNGNDYSIVITPRCDLAIPEKTITVQLAKCRTVNTDWDNLSNEVSTALSEWEEAADGDLKTKLEKKLKNKRENLRKFTQHDGNKTSLHFIPQMKLLDETTIGPFFVEFAKITTIDFMNKPLIESIEKSRIASLTPEFLPSLVERLGSYFSRIGTPNYSHPE